MASNLTLLPTLSCEGGNMTKKVVGFGREVLVEICDYLMNQEDEALGCEERCIIALLYAAVGRGGEVSFTTWNSARWELLLLQQLLPTQTKQVLRVLRLPRL